MARESLLAQTFVELADNLVDAFDVVDLLTLLADRCVEVLGTTAAGIMLASPQGDLRSVASSSEELRLVEVFEIQAEDGPCWDCFMSGKIVVQAELASAAERWPKFVPFAVAAGFHSAQALPLRLRGQTIGALNLLDAGPSAMGLDDLTSAQALADVATIAILQNRAFHEAQQLNEQLSRALTSRVTVEQAKGMLAERAGWEVDEAFARLRKYARDRNLLLIDVARDVVNGRLRDLSKQL